MNRRIIRRSAVQGTAIAAAIAVMALAPAGALAKNVIYTGPVAGPGNEGVSIQMRVRLKHGKPTMIYPFKVVGAPPCQT